jgi:hypothetical protein
MRLAPQCIWTPLRCWRLRMPVSTQGGGNLPGSGPGGGGEYNFQFARTSLGGPLSVRVNLGLSLFLMQPMPRVTHLAGLRFFLFNASMEQGEIQHADANTRRILKTRKLNTC